MSLKSVKNSVAYATPCHIHIRSDLARSGSFSALYFTLLCSALLTLLPNEIGVPTSCTDYNALFSHKTPLTIYYSEIAHILGLSLYPRLCGTSVDAQ
jgi:hypothetical protein